MADMRISFNDSAPPYAVVEEDYPPEPIENNTETSQSKAIIQTEDNNDYIINTIWLLTKDTFTVASTSNEITTNEKIFTPRVIAAFIILSSIFIGPSISSIIGTDLELRTIAILTCIVTGIFLGLNTSLLLDRFTPLPKYVTLDIGILSCLFITPINCIYLPSVFTLIINLFAFCEFLFLLLIMSGTETRFVNQFVYVIILLVIYFMSSFVYLPFFYYDDGESLYIGFHVTFVVLHGFMLFCIGLPRVQEPIVCVTFVWFGIWLLQSLHCITLYCAIYVQCVVILLLLLAFFIGLFLSVQDVTNDIDNVQNANQPFVLRWIMKCWEFHKYVVTIRSKKVENV